MAGKHSANTSKKPIIITICAVLAVAIAVVCVVLLVPLNNNSNDNKIVSTSATADSVSKDSEVYTLPKDDNSKAESVVEKTNEDSSAFESKQESESSAENQVVVVPTEEGAKVSYFEGSFTPSRAYESDTEKECPLKEVFGSAYAGGSIDFKGDGTFTDSISLTSANSGGYALTGSTITVTYTNDKNIFMTVTKWDGDTPAEIEVSFGGYEVFFS